MKNVKARDRKFIEKFVGLYADESNLEFFEKNVSVKRTKLNKLKKKISFLLPEYPVLFQDLNLLHKIFNDVLNKKRRKFAFELKFEVFLEWTFEELLRNKIINKEDFRKLKNGLASLILNL
mgnify:CR=1 FL=1